MMLVDAPRFDAMRSAAIIRLLLKDPLRVLPERKAMRGALMATGDVMFVIVGERMMAENHAEHKSARAQRRRIGEVGPKQQQRRRSAET